MLEENIAEVKKRISKSCESSGRNLSEITLVAVSKNNPIDKIIDAQKFGLENFGENKAQELKEKATQHSSSLNWHFIGHLQRNKVKDVINFVEIIHSVDTIKLADEINKRALTIDKKQRILLEANTSGEKSKFGLNNFEEILELAEYCSTLPNLKLEGLMTMAPYTDNKELIRNCFKLLKQYLDRLNSKGYKITELSMGMTNDYEIAIQEGATILRIGTAIFGDRA
jgi:pyridoxal phosphate enzyme (YggS family)